jgi:cytochrome c553
MSAGRIRRAALAMLALTLPIIPSAGHAANDPESIAQALYTALRGGDSDAMAALLAPEVMWTLQGPVSSIPYAGSFRGPQAVRQFFQVEQETVRVESNTPLSFVTHGDTVLVRGIEQGVALATDGRYTANWWHEITVSGGRITHFEEIVDSAQIVDALAPADAARGRAYFTTCAGCHAPDGRGNRDMNAPNLTGLDSGYLIRQLRHFVSGVRGGSTNFYGWQMNGRAKALPGERALRDVAAYIETLTPQSARRSISADAARGRELYRSCAACHGERGQGNSKMGAPALAQLDDWYQVRQLRDFRSGARGAGENDVAGTQMRVAAAALPNDAAVADVAAYISSWGGS